MTNGDYTDLKFWGPSLDELKSCPLGVQRAVGRSFWEVQSGGQPSGAKPFGEGGDKLRGVMKLSVWSENTNTYRAAYVTKFDEAVYVLAVFEKKSTSGVATPKADIERVAERFNTLRAARLTPAGRLEIERLKQMRAKRKALTAMERRDVPNSPKPRGR